MFFFSLIVFFRSSGYIKYLLGHFSTDIVSGILLIIRGIILIIYGYGGYKTLIKKQNLSKNETIGLAMLIIIGLPQ